MKSFDLFASRRIGKTGKPYICLFADLHYRVVPITFDAGLIAEFFGVSRRELESQLAQGDVYIE